MINTQTVKTKGFALFGVLVVVVLIGILGVVGFVAMKQKNTSPVVVPDIKVMATPTSDTQMTDNTTDPTPVPSLSGSTDIEVIGKEMNDTKVESVDSDFKAMNSSASSL